MTGIKTINKNDNWILNSLTSKKTFIVLLVFQCLVLGFILAFCSIKYEVSDDFIIELILSGGFSGKPDWHLMFSNPILGLMLYPLYLLSTSVSWYFVFQLLVCFASYISISWVFSDKNNKILGIALTVILTMATAGDLYILPQFTKTAAAAIIAGSLLFLHGRFKEDTILPSVLGALLVIIGTLLRFDVLYSVGLFILIAIIVYLVRSFIKTTEKIKWLLKKVLPALLLIGIVFGLRTAGNHIFLIGEGYDHYREYNAVRSSIVDYSYQDYSEYAEELGELGFTENDYFLLRHWCFGDSDKYDLENMKKVSQVISSDRNQGSLSINSVISYLKDRKFKNYSLIWWLILLGVICIISNWRKSWVPVLCAFLVLFYIIIFYHLGRNVYRVEFGFLFAAGVVIAWAADRTRSSSIEQLRALFSCVCAGIAIGSALTIWLPKPASYTSGDECRDNIIDYLYKSGDYKIEKYSIYMNYGNIYGDFIKMARGNPQNVYFMEFSTTVQTLYFNFSPFECASSVFPENLFWTGGVATEYPAANNWLDEHGYSSMFKALLDENVYYVGNWWSDNVLTFLHENGYPNATAELVETVDDYDIYKFHN